MKLKAGASQKDISPKTSQFLYGYPHVERCSTGIHDKILASALYLSDGNSSTMIIANDIIFLPKDMIERLRKQIQELTQVPATNVMISCTHTHSAPITAKYISNEADPIVPQPDEQYLQLVEKQILSAAVEAFRNATDAKAGFAIADDTGVGTNRRDPKAAADHNVPVMLVKSAETGKTIACMLVCSMHPTVLHEDSTLVSGDFPGLSRLYLQENVVGDCPVLHHSGCCGNQSPRHVTKANTFDEAKRIGEILAKAVEKAIANMQFSDNLPIKVKNSLVDLPKRQFPSVEKAEKNLTNSINRLESLRKNNASVKDIRTAECDWFGAEETLTLAKSAADGRLAKVYEQILPAEIQIISIGDWNFVGWMGEIFVEYALEVKSKAENTFIISLANGEMQGYIVTEEADKEGGYEASNSLLSYKSGNILVDETLKLLKKG